MSIWRWFKKDTPKQKRDQYWTLINAIQEYVTPLLKEINDAVSSQENHENPLSLDLTNDPNNMLPIQEEVIKINTAIKKLEENKSLSDSKKNIKESTKTLLSSIKTLKRYRKDYKQYQWEKKNPKWCHRYSKAINRFLQFFAWVLRLDPPNPLNELAARAAPLGKLVARAYPAEQQDDAELKEILIVQVSGKTKKGRKKAEIKNGPHVSATAMAILHAGFPEDDDNGPPTFS